MYDYSAQQKPIPIPINLAPSLTVSEIRRIVFSHNSKVIQIDDFYIV